MKSKRIPLLASFALSSLLIFGVACSDDDGASDDSTPAVTVETMTPPSPNGEANDRNEFVDTVEARLQQLQTQIDDIRDETADMTADERAAAEARIEDLKQQMDDIRAKLDGVPSLSDEDFEALKADIEGGLDSAMTQAQDLADKLGF